jgi:hypothetical protein
MKTVKWPALAIAAGLFAANAAAAPEAKFGGVIFAQGVMTTSNRDFANAADMKGRYGFDVTRLYLTADVKFDDHWKAKGVVESRTEGVAGTATAGQNTAFLKGAYLEYGDLLGSGANVQFGQFPTSWDTFETGIQNRRYVVKNLADLMMALPTWDKGVAVYGKLPMGFGDYNLSVLNGEGTTVTEGTTGATGRQKAYGGLISIVPVPNNDMLKGLRLNVFAQQEKQGLVSATAGEGLLPTRDRNYFFAGASYKGSNGYLMATYYSAKKATAGTTFANVAETRPKGYSIHGALGLPMDMQLFARADRFDAGQNTASQDLTTVTPTYGPRQQYVLGIEKKMADGVRFAIADIMNKQRNKGLEGVSATAKRYENTLGVYAEAKF